MTIIMLTTCYHLKDVILLFFLSLILFTLGLSSQEIIGFDSRFYLFAQEMWREGLSWFPTTYHQLYPDYPVTSTWLIYLAAKFFGELNKFVAVLPSAILASLTIVFTYLIGALHHKRLGLYAVFFLLLTATFIKSARSISLDMYPTFITTMCFYLIYSADKENKPGRIKWIYLLLFFSFAFRGPIGLVVPAGVICSYYLLDKKIKQFFLTGGFAFILLLISTALLLGLAYFAGGDTFMRDVLRMEVLGRMDNHYLPRYFYFTSSLTSYALSFPLAVLVLLGVLFYTYFKRYEVTDIAFLVKLVGWIFVILIGMSIPDDKKIRYILPMLPAVSLIAAYPWAASATQSYFIYLRKLMVRLFFILPLLLLLSTLAIYFYAYQYSLHFPLAYGYLMMFFFIMQVINLCIFHSRAIGVLCVASLSFVLAYVFMIEPIELFINRAHDFVAMVEKKRLEQQARLVFYKEKPDGLPIKYLINMPHAAQPEFIEQQQDLMAFKVPAFFVASQSYFDELPKESVGNFDVIARDSLGHVPVVVFVRITK